MTDRVRLRELASTFFMIGLTSYGGPAIVAQIRNVAVRKKAWLTDEEFGESLAFCQLLPGAIAVQTSAHVAWRLRGPIGALVATVAYTLPAFGLILGLSAAYFRMGEVPAVESLLQGLRAVVVAIVLDSILSMARSALKDWRGIALAAVAAAALALGSGALLALLGCALAATLVFWGQRPPGDLRTSLPSRRLGRTTIVAVAGVSLLAAAAVVLSGALAPDLPALALAMMKIDMLAFGGGYTAVALMHDQVVQSHNWLTTKEFIDGLAIGQLTPGPVILTATFIGFKVARWWGALLATVSIFLPSWLLLVLLSPQFERIRGLTLVYRMMRGLLAAFIAILAYVLWQIAQEALQDWRSFLLAAAAFTALRFKVPALWVVGAGVLAAALLFR